MSSKDQNLSSGTVKIDNPSESKIGIVVSEWNSEITSAMHKACVNTLVKSGLEESNIETVHVPGTFELPVGAKILLGHEAYDAVICIGCVIKGETKHDEYISSAVAQWDCGR